MRQRLYSRCLVLIALGAVAMALVSNAAEQLPATGPSSRPVEEVELGKHRLPDGRHAVLVRQIRYFASDDNQEGALGYRLYRLDSDGRREQLLWETPGSWRAGISFDNQDPKILALDLQGKVLVIVYNQRDLCWGDVVRIADGDHPDTALKRIRAIAPVGGDFGDAKDHATIDGAYGNRTLGITVTEETGRTFRYSLRPVNDFTLRPFDSEYYRWEANY